MISSGASRLCRCIVEDCIPKASDAPVAVTPLLLPLAARLCALVQNAALAAAIDAVPAQPAGVECQCCAHPVSRTLQGAARADRGTSTASIACVLLDLHLLDASSPLLHAAVHSPRLKLSRLVRNQQVSISQVWQSCFDPDENPFCKSGGS